MNANANSARKRKASASRDLPGGTVLSTVNLSLADLNKLIDQRLDEKTVALTSRVDSLQRENERLCFRCESLERSVQVLKREGNWTYSAPDVPRSHWIEQGHDEEYADDAEELIQSIKQRTEILRSDGDEDVIISSEALVLSDDALRPHWEQLAKAIQLSESVDRIDLRDVQVHDRTLQMIETSVRQKGITRLWLVDNQFRGGEGVQFAIDVLKNNRTIERFHWAMNPFHHAEHAYELIDAVMEQPAISIVAFTISLVGGVTLQRLFGEVGADTLLCVDLTGNNIKTNDDRCIPRFLSTNPLLEELYLGQNQFNDDDGIHIAQALQSNINLEILDLESNALTEKGKHTMYHQSLYGLSQSDISTLIEFKTVVRGFNMNTVSGANHSCEIHGISDPEDFMNESNMSAKWNLLNSVSKW